jgi:hypothetical protein
MKILIVLIAWFILLAIAWPLAILVLVLFPILWLLSIPFRIVGALLEGLVALVKALLLLPARLLGYRAAPN